MYFLPEEYVFKMNPMKVSFYFNELYLKLKSRVKFAILVNLLIAMYIILSLPYTYCFCLKKIFKLFLRKDSMLIDNYTILVINIIPHLMDFSHHDILCKFLGWIWFVTLGTKERRNKSWKSSKFIFLEKSNQMSK